MSRPRWFACLVCTVAAGVLVGTSGCAGVSGSAALSAPFDMARASGAPGQVVHIVQVEGRPYGAEARAKVVPVSVVRRSEGEWQVPAVDPASSSITLEWLDGGDPACGGINQVQVAQTPRSVTVGLVDTARDPKLACTAEGHARRLQLRLEQPLGDRALLEPVTGVNDGLPHFQAGLTAPIPACSTNSTPRDAPIGMADAASRMAPTSAVRAVICRIAWPRGSARTSLARVDNVTDVRRLARALDQAADRAPASSVLDTCGSRSPGAWYAVYFTAPHTQVEVFVDQINCGTVTNGAQTARTTAQVDQLLAAAFSRT